MASASLAAFFGLGYLIMPEMNLEMYELQTSDSALSIMQSAGAAYLGYAAIAFAFMNISDAPTIKMLALGFMGAWICTTAVSLYFVVNSSISSTGWVSVIIGLFFVVMYGMKRFGK